MSLWRRFAHAPICAKSSGHRLRDIDTEYERPLLGHISAVQLWLASMSPSAWRHELLSLHSACSRRPARRFTWDRSHASAATT